LIGRGPLRLSHVLAVSVLTAGLVTAGFLTHPSPAYAGSGEVAATASHVVTFDAPAGVLDANTTATTVGAFLAQRGITPLSQDYLNPSADTPISERMTITYRPAVPVTIVIGREKRVVTTTASDVATLLADENIALDANDEVRPAPSDRVPANGIVKITRVMTWERTEKRAIPAPVEHRVDFNLDPGGSKVLAKGSSGVRQVRVIFTQRDGGSITAHVVKSRVLIKPHARIVAVGIGEYAAFERFASRGVQMTSRLAASALDMVATAYTAGCSGCSGITAIGRPAGHGIVAVDPRVIPLGTHLYIPGYGFAIAGDTGGAIVGNRIDLGFDSYADAIRFGRREVTVYRLR
jgi:resuscitation-promoting factor RpfB